MASRAECAYRVAAALLRILSLLVPKARRARWLEEWRAEVWHGLEGGSAPRSASVLRFVRGALRDALDTRRWPTPGRPRTPVGDGFGHDIRLGLRALASSPGFTLLSVAMLSIGIGANTAVFTLVRDALVGRLGFPAAERLVSVWERRPEQGRDRNPASLPDFVDWRDQNRSFRAMATHRLQNLNLVGGDRPEAMLGAEVTGGFLTVMEVDPALGRDFSAREAREGASVVILSHQLWSERFGADPEVLGTTVQLDLEPHTVIGVMPAGFAFPSEAEFWFPRTDDPTSASRNSHGFQVVARLRDGVTVEGAWNDLDRVARALEAQYSGNRGHYTAVYPLRDELLGDTRQSLLLLLAGVGAVLLIVCVNVANMEIVRSSAQARSLAIRATMGATRWRLVRQQLTELLLLTGLAGLVSLGVATGLHRLLRGSAASSVPWGSELGLDLPMLGITLAIALGTSLIFGLAPAIRGSRLDLASRLREGSQRTGLGRGGRRWQSGLVVAQVALAFVLVSASTLLARNLAGLLTVDPGFDVEGVTVAEMTLPPTRYDTEERVRQFTGELLERLRVVPGVESAALAWILPLSGQQVGRNIYLEGRPIPENMDEWNTRVRVVSHGYFDAIGMRILTGRDFESGDAPESPLVALANETLAERYWPEGDAIGSRIAFDDEGPWVEIVGIVNDVRHNGPGRPAEPEAYLSLTQNPVDFLSLVVRAEGGGGPTPETLRAVVREVDPDQPLSSIHAMDELLSAWIGRPRELAWLGGAFALMALALATMGVYGVVSFSVARRTREFGVRLALGGRGTQVLGGAMASGTRLIGAGLVLGALGAPLLSRLIAPLLTDTPAGYPALLGASSGLLAAVTLLAVYVPARRATRVDPTKSLRAE
jgi:putative ABC transport system permease protein